MSPLADRMRPKTLDEIVGQEHIIGKDKLLYKAIKSGNIFSMIFWGPPGVGKTTLARVIANELNAEFLEFSAVNTSTSDLKKMFEEIKKGNVSTNSAKSLLLFERSENYKTDKTSRWRSKSNTQPVVFIDEIHRFNKAQQDAFLPYVENGTIILIGATTENPSFEVIGPLLSRTRVFVLEQLTVDDLNELIDRALKDKLIGLGKHKIKLEKEAREFLIEASSGDARVVLNALEIAASNVIPSKVFDPESSDRREGIQNRSRNKSSILSPQTESVRDDNYKRVN